MRLLSVQGGWFCRRCRGRGGGWSILVVGKLAPGGGKIVNGEAAAHEGVEATGRTFFACCMQIYRLEEVVHVWRSWL